jgi:hypothetical protein
VTPEKREFSFLILKVMSSSQTKKKKKKKKKERERERETFFTTVFTFFESLSGDFRSATGHQQRKEKITRYFPVRQDICGSPVTAMIPCQGLQITRPLGSYYTD